MPADLLIRGAKIFTMDQARPWASAFAVSKGRFSAIGSAGDLEPLVGPKTEIVEAEGKLVLPGLIDCHSHAFEGARADLYEVRLSPADNVDGFIRAVGNAIVQKSDDGWLKGAGWAARLAGELARPEVLKAFDKATGGRPTALRDSSHHAMFANSAAMRAAGVTLHMSNPENGEIVRDADGRPTGLFLENACALIERAMPAESSERQRTIARRAASIYNGFGVTGFIQAAASETTMRVFADLDRTGSLNAWIATCIATDSLLTPEHEGIGFPVIARRAIHQSPHVAVNFVKFFMDGVPGTRTAAFVEPYSKSEDGDVAHPRSFHSADELLDLILSLDAQGVHVKIHAVGDQAIRDSLDAIEAVRRINGSPGTQHSIAHLSYISDGDIPRLAALNVAADFCPPLWFPNPILLANTKALGEARGQHAWPIGDIIRSGAHSMLGTDWPIVPTPNPWLGLAGVITRRHPNKAFPGVFRAEQALSLDQALPLCTINVAQCMGFGHLTGSICVGKFADFIILNQDLFSIDPQAIADTAVLRTYFSGRIVHCA